MRALLTTSRHLLTDRRGVSAIEYGLIGAFIATVIATAVASVGTDLAGRLASFANNL